MSVSNFFPVVLFIISFSPPSILPQPHCVSKLSLFIPPLCRSKHILLNRSFLWTLQLCCSAFRRCEYLQFCMFANLWWARDSHHCSNISVCLWMRASMTSMIVWTCADSCVCVCVFVWLVQSNPDYAHLLAFQFREKEKHRMGVGRGWESGGRRDEHPSYEQQTVRSVIPPQATAALAGRRLKQHLSLETTESINSAWKRITLLEWRTSSFSTYICLMFSHFHLLSLFLLFSIMHIQNELVTCVLCAVSPCLMCIFSLQQSQGSAADMGGGGSYFCIILYAIIIKVH